MTRKLSPDRQDKLDRIHLRDCPAKRELEAGLCFTRFVARNGSSLTVPSNFCCRVSPTSRASRSIGFVRAFVANRRPVAAPAPRSNAFTH